MVTRSTPSIEMAPAVGRIMPDTTRMSVVLPAPLGPITATASPWRTCSETSKRAWKVP